MTDKICTCDNDALMRWSDTQDCWLCVECGLRVDEYDERTDAEEWKYEDIWFQPSDFGGYFPG